MASVHGKGKNGSSNTIVSLDAKRSSMAAYVTSDQAKANLVIAGRIAANKHVLKAACSKFANADDVYRAAVVKLDKLTRGTGLNLWKGFRKVIDEVDRTPVPPPDPDRVTITDEGVAIGDGPVQPFDELKRKP